MSRLHCLPLLPALVLLLALACPPLLADDGEQPIDGARSMKGWELYSWQAADSDSWHYRLMQGTNMLKTAESICEEGEEQTLDEIVKAIGELAEGQEVFWPGASVMGQDAESPFGFPDEESVTALREAAKDAGVVLHVIDDEQEEMPPLAHSMKGWELYCWQDEDSQEWRYCLMTGTNRLKSLDEICDPTRALTLDEIIAALAGLADGQEVFWPGPAAWASGEDMPFELPDAESREAIEQAAVEAGLVLHLLGVDEEGESDD